MPVAADVGKRIGVRVDFTDDRGFAETLASAPVARGAAGASRAATAARDGWRSLNGGARAVAFETTRHARHSSQHDAVARMFSQAGRKPAFCPPRRIAPALGVLVSKATLRNVGNAGPRPGAGLPWGRSREPHGGRYAEGREGAGPGAGGRQRTAPPDAGRVRIGREVQPKVTVEPRRRGYSISAAVGRSCGNAGARARRRARAGVGLDRPVCDGIPGAGSDAGQQLPGHVFVFQPNCGRSRRERDLGSGTEVHDGIERGAAMC